MKLKIAFVVFSVLIVLPFVGCSGGGSSNSNSNPTTDTEAPTIPNNVSAKSTSSSSNLVSWAASTDNIGVRGYEVYRNGLKIGESTTASYIDSGLIPSTPYSYAIAAYDAAGNTSDLSTTIPVKTLAALVPSNRSVGIFVAGWHWGAGFWSEAADDDLIQSARNLGISVVHLMLPQFEDPLGTYKESELVKLDHFLASASDKGMYAMLPFLNIFGNAALNIDDPYHNPSGIRGLMFDNNLKTAFKNRITFVMNRRNTINGRIYKDDPTIAAWIVGDEPISAPFNYPAGEEPNLTVQQFAEWLEEMASYIKSIDVTGAVSIFITAAHSTLLGGDWMESLDVPSIDFVYAEDADAFILNYFYPNAATDYSLHLFSIGKPVIAELSFTSGSWDLSNFCNDYTEQAQIIKDASMAYFNSGAQSVLVQRWGTDIYPTIPSFDECFTYTDSNTEVSLALSSVANQIN